MEQLLLEAVKELPLFACVFGALMYVIRWVGNSVVRRLEKVERQLVILTLIISGFRQQSLGHDLTVSGVNPSMGDDIDERTNKAYLKYLEVLNEMETLNKTIEAELHRKD